MARARNIKPGVMENEDLAELAPLTRLLFIYLWMLADREGRLEDRPKQIRAKALPYDAVDADEMLSDLARMGFLIRYEVDSKRFIQIVNFVKHQRPHSNEVASEIPPSSQELSTLVESTSNQGEQEELPEPEALRSGFSDSLIPDSLIAGEKREDAPAKPSPADRGTRLPKDWEPDDEQIAFCRNERPDLDPRGVASRFRDHWIAQPGVKGRKSDWPATWRNWVRNERASARASPTTEKFDPVAYVNSNRVDRFAGAK